MATVVKLHVFPESFNQHRTRLLRSSFFGPSTSSPPRVLGFGHNCEGLSVKQFRAFRSEDGGDLKEKKIRTLKKNEVNSKRESGFWNSLKYILLRSKSDDVYRHALVKVEEVLSVIAIQIGRYIVTMMSTGVILAIGFQMSGGDSQMDALIWYSWLGGIIIGTMIGANMVLEEHCRAGPRNVVITGSTRGLGKALAREFLLSGDRVVVTSRSPESVEATIKELEENLKEGINNAVGSSLSKLSHAKVVGIASDVCEPHDVQRLGKFAVNELGHIDIWIVSTNLVGSILCTREAMHIMRNQAKAGHIFNMDGNGSGGSSTPLTAVGSTVQNRQMFNIICELPETVARTLVPRMRVVKGTGKAISYLTPPRILLALVTAWLRRGRWFDDKGRALYAAEADRLRNWAENRARFSFTDAMEMYTENTCIGSGSNFSAAESLSKSSQALSLGFVKSTFSFEELMCATDGFSDANLLGSGGFGYVHRGLLANGKEVAVKQLKSGSRQGEREFQAELEIISRVHHKHLVSLVGYCITGTQRLLVYEFIPNNTLEFHLHGKGRPTMDWLTRMRIALGSAKGLAYLHEDCHPKIIHRDIKAANILLDFKFEAKVADFGLAKISSESNTHVSTRVMGNFGYLAPEYASTGKLTDKSDVFSYGIMLLELITGKRPVDKNYSFTDSLVDWARPLLTHSLEENDFDSLVDPRLQNEFDRHEMARMVACAAACVCHSAKRRPRMSQVVRALEGDVSLSDLSEKIVPGNTTPYSSYDSSDYDPSQYKEDMKKFRKTALEGTHEYGASSGYSGTSDYGLYPSGSSSEAQSRRNTMEMNKLNRKGFSPGKS
ncbi:hypothetical protein TanjilG_05883 [Lupinus angustifolius]|uniref:non-specific serine/threonine protein kinase n=1 Tax=Lupinus angustifolius TaxID=3871 RepID=A0A4P1RDY9_LUPAN|nr:hypothetical protein TanjilG_05883 [Lupinus angustifolius]